MSFTIEDILKKDTDDCDDKKKLNNRNSEQHTQILCDTSGIYSNNSDGSILHHTLMNRLRPNYYRPISEIQSVPMTSNFNNFFNFEKTVYSNGYWPYYNGQAGTSNYQKPKSWSYITQNIHPFHFAHYSKRKGGQVRFTANQTDILEKKFISNKYLAPEERKVLADILKLTDRQVKTWFQNRRAKWRRSKCSSEINGEMSDRLQIKMKSCS